MTGGRTIDGKTLLELESFERLQTLLAFLRDQAALVLGVSAEALAPDVPLSTFGLDSLAAIGLKNAVEVVLGVALPLPWIFEGPSLSDMAARVVTELRTEPRIAPRHASSPAACATARRCARWRWTRSR